MKAAPKRKPAARRTASLISRALAQTAKTASAAKPRVGPSSASVANKPVPVKDRRLNFGSKWDYAPALEDCQNILIAQRHELFIGGKLVTPHSGRYFDSVNPATEEKLT